MAFKLKTSKKTEEILTQIESRVNIPYATLVKLSLALSLRQGPLSEEDFKTNNLGRELNRQTITGDSDPLYKCLFEVCANRHMSDEEYFPGAVKAHLDRGSILLQNELRYSGSDFLEHLSELDKGL
ncbi:MAG: DndE family protein [Thermoguttaceae bacterium]